MNKSEKGNTVSQVLGLSEAIELSLRIKLLGGILHLAGEEIPYCDPVRSVETLRKFGATIENLAQKLESHVEKP
jgi:hypothetical protein